MATCHAITSARLNQEVSLFGVGSEFVILKVSREFSVHHPCLSTSSAAFLFHSVSNKIDTHWNAVDLETARPSVNPKMYTLLCRDGHLTTSNIQPQELISTVPQGKAKPKNARKGVERL